MKTTHIIILVIIVVVIGVVVSLVYDADTYADFETARQHPGTDFQIIGTLDTTRPIVYDPRVNTDMFSFFMFDSKNELEKVWYKGAKPQDFELSDRVVLIGQYADTAFMAHTMLLKCPSKYNNEMPAEWSPQEFKTDY